jgi:hypothetical protein
MISSLRPSWPLAARHTSESGFWQQISAKKLAMVYPVPQCTTNISIWQFTTWSECTQCWKRCVWLSGCTLYRTGFSCKFYKSNFLFQDFKLQLWLWNKEWITLQARFWATSNPRCEPANSEKGLFIIGKSNCPRVVAVLALRWSCSRDLQRCRMALAHIPWPYQKLGRFGRLCDRTWMAELPAPTSS